MILIYVIQVLSGVMKSVCGVYCLSRTLLHRRVGQLRDAQQVDHGRIDPRAAEHLWNHVDAVAIVHGEHALHWNGGEQGDLLPNLLGHGGMRPARDDVRMNPGRVEKLQVELRRLGLLLAQDARLHDVGQGDEAEVPRSLFVGHLSNRFDVVGVLDIADGAADFDKDHVGLAGDRQLTQAALHLTGYVGDHLHVASDSKAAARFADGHYLQIEVAAKVAASDQPELADQFLKFMVSDAFQSVIPTTNWMYPAVIPQAGLPDGFDTLITPDTALIYPAADAIGARDEALAEWLAVLSQ